MIEIALGTALFIVIVLSLTLIVLVARNLLLQSQAVSITVNNDRPIAAWTGQKLFYALGGAGIALPSACAGAGTCGLCQVIVVAGGGEAMPTETSTLSRADIRAGKRLACQVMIRADMAVRVDEALLSAGSWQCTVRSSRSLAPLIKEIVLAMPDAGELRFRAGAYVQVTVPEYKLSFAQIEIAPQHVATWDRLGLRGLSATSALATSRAYSIANLPGDRDCIVLNVRLALPPPDLQHAPPGVVSSFLFGVQAGDTLSVSGPYGEFAVQDTEREMVFIGGGVGMAPLRAMIFEQLEGAKTTRKISFWYGARSREELFYTDEFERLQKTHGNFRCTVVLSEPKPDDAWTGPSGFIHDAVAKQFVQNHPAPEECEYYLCGPRLMTQAVVSMLEDAGVERDAIFNDDFGG